MSTQNQTWPSEPAESCGAEASFQRAVIRSADKGQDATTNLLRAALSTVMVGALLSVTFWVMPLSLNEFQSDFAAAPARLLVKRWSEGKAVPRSRSQWETAVFELRTAADIQPRDPLLSQDLGMAWTIGSAQPWATPVERVLWLGQAQFHYRLAAKLQPHNAWNWAWLATVLARAGQFGSEMDGAARNALKLGPNEGHVQEILLPLVLQHWEKVPADLQGWVRMMYEKGNASQRAAISRTAERYGRQI